MAHRKYANLPDDEVADHLVKWHDLGPSVAYYTHPAKLHAHHYVEHKNRTCSHEHPMIGEREI